MMPRRVIRVGGSLLTWNAFATAMNNWLADEVPGTEIFIVGGGPWVELLRQAARRFRLKEESAHWNCVRAMSVTAQLLANVMGWPIVRSLPEIKTLDGEARIVFDVFDFLDNSTHIDGEQALPASWDVTSDSISARVAAALNADELVLLKSQVPPGTNIAELARLGYVDAWFPRAVTGLEHVRFVNLRSFAERQAESET